MNEKVCSTFLLVLYVKLVCLSLNRRGGLWHYLSPTYNALLSSLSPDSLTTIYTWAHPALATHMKATWVNDPEEALRTLKLRANMSP